MRENHKVSPSLHLVWVSPETPIEIFSVARLNITRELRRLGWDVTLIGTGSTGRCQIQGVELLCLPRPQVYFLGMLMFHLNVLRVIRQEWERTDIILFHQISAIWILSLRIVRGLMGKQRPLFIMDTRDIPDFIPGNIKYSLRHLYIKLAYWLAAHLADGQTTITPRMAQFANIPSRQLLGTWPSGVYPELFNTARLSRSWPTGNEPIQLIYIGSFEKKRNLSNLCLAVEQANANNMSFVLTMVGDGRARSQLELFAAKSAGNIFVQPSVPHERIPELLGKAHIGVTPLPAPDQIKYQASSPIKLFEYMAAGLPILATSNVCHTEVVGNGNFAFWANSADEAELLAALKQIWHCQANLTQMGDEAAGAVGSWTWEASARKLSDTLKKGMAKQ